MDADLAALGIGERIERIQVLWSGYGEIARYRRGDHTVVVKRVEPPEQVRHPRGWGSDRGHRRKLRSYEVEAAWYRTWAEACPARVAASLHASPRLLVLEDLDAAGYATRLRALPDARLDQVVGWLATFHRHHLDRAPDGLWPQGTYWQLETRPDELQRMQPGALRDAAKELDRALRTCPVQTLVHGDAKPANFCFGPDGVAAVDFQYVGGGVGVRDLVYLLGTLAEKRLFDAHARWVDRYFELLDSDRAEQAWRPLIPTAWADFERFLAGWAPEHAKRTGFAAEQTRIALTIESLRP